MKISKSDALALLKCADAARRKSYCPYSHVSVGCALRTKDGKIYEGANIENSAMSPGICAERAAFFAAVLDGESDFDCIAVSGGRQGECGKDGFTPCGVCRQVMAEFCSPDFEIIVQSGEGTESYSLSSLLPHGFGKELL